MKKLYYPIAGAFLLILGGCSEPAPKAEVKVEKPEPITGQSALYKMYQVARTAWATDAQVLKVNSIILPEVPTTPGKAGAWEATFVSPSLSRARSYTFCIIEGPGNLHKGPFAGLEEGWSGPHGISAPFPAIAVKIDTDAAYQTALSNGGTDYDQKNPGKPITLLLEKVSKFPDPAWRVIWGESVGTASFSVYVDASTGAFLEKMH